jgi:hypothetical protein
MLEKGLFEAIPIKMGKNLGCSNKTLHAIMFIHVFLPGRDEVWSAVAEP